MTGAGYMANYCTKCGALNEDDAKFCYACGSAFTSIDFDYEDTDKTIVPERVAVSKSVSDTKRCENCGAEISSDAKFCYACGAVLSDSSDGDAYAWDGIATDPESELSQSTMFCVYCGAEIPSDSKFCYVCGAQFDDANVDEYASADDNASAVGKKKKSKAPLVIIVVLLLLALLVGGIFAVAYFTDINIPFVSALVKEQETEAEQKKDDEKPAASEQTTDAPEEDQTAASGSAATENPGMSGSSSGEASSGVQYIVSYSTPSHAGVVLRAAASSESTQLGILKEGTPIKVTGQTEGAYSYVECVDAPSMKGWIMTQYILSEILTTSPSAGESPVTPTTTQAVVPKITSATTMSGTVLSSSNVSSNRTFGADCTIDKDAATCWCVNTTSSGGAGAQIKFALTPGSTISGVKLINGNQYLPDEKIYESNGQVCTFTLTFSDGSTRSFAADYNEGTSDWQTFSFGETITTDYIILTVDSGYIGNSYNTNVCLGEFDVLA